MFLQRNRIALLQMAVCNNQKLVLLILKSSSTKSASCMVRKYVLSRPRCFSRSQRCMNPGAPMTSRWGSAPMIFWFTLAFPDLVLKFQDVGSIEQLKSLTRQLQKCQEALVHSAKERHYQDQSIRSKVRFAACELCNIFLHFPLFLFSMFALIYWTRIYAFKNWTWSCR